MRSVLEEGVMVVVEEEQFFHIVVISNERQSYCKLSFLVYNIHCTVAEEQ